MKRLTDITARHRVGQELTTEDIRFLYEVDGVIQGFGYNKDPRIKEILETRDTRTDLVKVLNCRPEQIALTQEEALSGDIVYYNGDLDLSGLTTAEGLVLPKSIGGNIYLNNLPDADLNILKQRYPNHRLYP